jgi:hypothetical protein
MATILADGRVTTDVEVHGSPKSTVSLIIDTGAEASALPNVSMPARVKSAPASRPITFYIAGTAILTFRLAGTSSQTDVEAHGGGPPIKATSPNIRVHYIATGTAPFIGFDGLLGMDMLDNFAADLVKNKAGSRAYLATRI